MKQLNIISQNDHVIHFLVYEKGWFNIQTVEKQTGGKCLMTKGYKSFCELLNTQNYIMRIAIK